MARDVNISVQNQFTRGLITEATALNFPENACTETFDCKFDRLGSVRRRLGIDHEANSTATLIDRDSAALSSYFWRNATGDGLNNLWVIQVGGVLHFWRTSNATTSNNHSGQHLATTITLSSHVVSGSSFDVTQECQFADGNGYLFVVHPDMEPIYIVYNAGAGTITATAIPFKIRDTTGIIETGVDDATRPQTLTDNHRYNLANQGWNKAWTTTSATSLTVGTGSKVFTVGSNTLPIVVGDRVKAINAAGPEGSVANSMTGIVTSYSGFTLTVNVVTTTGAGTLASWTITPQPTYIFDWFRAIGNYPSNSDQWWFFKNPDPTDNSFDPTQMIDQVTSNAGAAPKGFFILDAFNQQRDTLSGISGLTDVTTLERPRTVAWFAGRVWYSGVEANTYNENVYFSQIVENTRQFGFCYQVNDLTSEERSDLLPSDGGVIRVQGAGLIYKLFPVQNGLLVFARNGIWFITGSQGIGFTANDHALVEISRIATLSASSFVNVQGYPIWWNEEGIYTCSPSEQGQLVVRSLTDTTIASFYQEIPFISKLFARGTFDPLNNIIQWTYSSTEAGSINARYEFDRVLNLNLQINAFYPWTISSSASAPKVHGVMYIPDFGNTDSPAAAVKYIISLTDGAGSYNFRFGEERDTTYVDWETPITGIAYTSYFVSGYTLKGQAVRKFQPLYVHLYCDNTVTNSYKFRTQWNFSSSGDSGKWSVEQTVTNTNDDFDFKTNRLKARGNGRAIQFRVTNNSTNPFNIVGWSIFESINKWV